MDGDIFREDEAFKWQHVGFGGKYVFRANKNGVPILKRTRSMPSAWHRVQQSTEGVQ